MITSPKTTSVIQVAFLCASLLSTQGVCGGQTATKAPSYPTSLPYGFTNFVWWSNDEIRTFLKRRIPNLGDEIAPESGMEHKIRDTLTMMLKEKGIAAEVQSQEPSNFSLTAERAPGSGPPAIAFSILSPHILIDKVIVSQAPEDLTASLNENLRRRERHEYSGGQDWLVRSNIEEALEAQGYLDGKIDISHDAPRRDGNDYLVNLRVSVKSGPQYRIGSISADGGPLLTGRDLSSHFSQKTGEIAGAGPFGRLAGELRAFYWHYGYADVETHGPPVLDRSNSTVSYHLDVVPGPLYHLRNLTIHNLSTEQENKVRELLGMKPGDIFDVTAINGLHHKISTDPLLGATSFTFSPAKDKRTAQADLTLDFHKVSDESSVTIK
jgi:hypothetical protein